MALTLLFFTLADDKGVDSQAGIVQEGAAIDLADVDLSHAPGENIGDRCFEFQGDFQVLGKMIERPQWKHAKRRFGANQRGGYTPLIVPSPPAATTRSVFSTIP